MLTSSGGEAGSQVDREHLKAELWDEIQEYSNAPDSFSDDTTIISHADFTNRGGNSSSRRSSSSSTGTRSKAKPEGTNTTSLENINRFHHATHDFNLS